MRKAIMITIAVLFYFSVCGQNSYNPNLSFNHLALSVKDLNRSVDFYKNVLGLQEITKEIKAEGPRWLSLGEGKELHLISTVKDTVIINKAVHLALTTNDFDAFIKWLDTNNVLYSDWPGTPNKTSVRADGIRQVYFQDPDGYWIEINSVGQK